MISNRCWWLIAIVCWFDVDILASGGTLLRLLMVLILVCDLINMYEGSDNLVDFLSIVVYKLLEKRHKITPLSFITRVW